MYLQLFNQINDTCSETIGRFVFPKGKQVVPPSQYNYHSVTQCDNSGIDSTLPTSSFLRYKL
jgi:hypothetical protein